MNPTQSMTMHETEADEIAKQFEVELALLVNIEDSLRIVLDWKTSKHGIIRKLSTLRFLSQSFERHLSRLRVLSEYGGYMHRVTDLKPHMANEVLELKAVRDGLQSELGKLMIELELIASSDDERFGRLCNEYRQFLDALTVHAQQERDLFLRSVYEVEGGQG